MVRCMLADSGFSLSMWGELFIKNRTSHNKALKMETPFKMLHGEEADLSRLHAFRARAFVHIKDSRTRRRDLGREGVRL